MMVKYLRMLCWLLILSLASGGWRVRSEQQTIPETKEAKLTGLIAETKGNVVIRFKGAKRFSPVKPNTPFRNGDLLLIADSAQAVIFCPDKSKVKLSAGAYPLPCHLTNTELIPIIYRGSYVRPPRSAPKSSEIPIVVSPRNTKLLNPRPTVRWLALRNTTKYQVSLHSLNELWHAEMKAPPIPATSNLKTYKMEQALTLSYPIGKPGLVLGEDYVVSVTAGSHSSDEEELSSPAFSLLPPQQAERVREDEKTIQSLRLTGFTTQFLIAQLYATYELNAEAIDKLTVLTRLAPSSIVWGALGDRYCVIGLNQFAAESYLNAIKSAQLAQEIEGEALARYALGRTYAEALGNKGEARQQLKMAQSLYQKLGDIQSVSHIESLIGEL